MATTKTEEQKKLEKKQKYAMIQLRADAHSKLKQYCEERDLIMGRYLAKIIENAIKQ